VELHFLVSCADEVIDDVGGRGVATGTAKPLATSKTSDNAAGVVNTTVSVISQYIFPKSIHVMNIRAGMRGQFLLFLRFRGIICAVDLVAWKTLTVIFSEKL
jgi:hypothetical protein